MELKDYVAASASVAVEDAIIIVEIKANAKVDIVKILEEMAAKTDNTIDDGLVQMFKMAAGNLDWKGFSKTL